VLGPLAGACAMVAFSLDSRPIRACLLTLAGLLAVLVVLGVASAAGV
jgi:hypothetical protein